MDMIALLKDLLNTSHKLKYGNTTPEHQLYVIMVLLVQEKRLLMKLLFTRLPSNLKNTNHLVHAISRELTMLNLKILEEHLIQLMYTLSTTMYSVLCRVWVVSLTLTRLIKNISLTLTKKECLAYT